MNEDIEYYQGISYQIANRLRDEAGEYQSKIDEFKMLENKKKKLPEDHTRLENLKIELNQIYDFRKHAENETNKTKPYLEEIIRFKNYLKSKGLIIN